MWDLAGVIGGLLFGLTSVWRHIYMPRSVCCRLAKKVPQTKSRQFHTGRASQGEMGSRISAVSHLNRSSKFWLVEIKEC